MSIKLIIFDFDGTLGDTRRNIVVTMQDVMKELSLPLQDEDVCASTIGLPLKGCYAKMFPQLNPTLTLCIFFKKVAFDFQPVSLFKMPKPRCRTQR
jgi:phosphoglycolate phosphatase-like HAD superfamily hydrolase